MKQGKIVRGLFVALLLLFSCHLWAYDVEIDGIYYNISKAEAKVTYAKATGGSYSGNVVIPEAIIYNGKKYPVTTIGDNAFSSCPELKSITIPNSVRYIGDSAFEWCTGLTDVTIPESVFSIGSSAFANCNSLFNVTTFDGLETIGDYAFAGCNDLSNFTLPSTTNFVGHGAFEGCTNLNPMDMHP